MRFSIVVLPLPDGPSTTTNSPRPTFSVTSSSALTRFSPTLKRRLTPCRWTSGPRWSSILPAAPAGCSSRPVSLTPGGYVARRTDSYPPEGLSRLSDAAAIAALTGGHLLTPPFDELLTRIEPAPAPNIIYTLGYTGSTPATVESYVKFLGAVLVDVRKSANSRVPHWRGAALAAQLGDRYLYLPDFGNDNYQGDGPIQLHNAAIVVEDARVLLQTQPIILLCGCADHRICHRTVAARYLAMWLNARVEHLPARESSRSRADRPILGLGV